MFHGEMENLERSLIKGWTLSLEELGAAAACLESPWYSNFQTEKEGAFPSLRRQGP